MNSDQNASFRAAVSAQFDLLRVQVETAVARPAVIAVVASTAGDGEALAARALAASFASAGYSTLFVDTSLTRNSYNASTFGGGFALHEVGLLESCPEPKPGIVAVLTLSDLALQKTTSQRDVQSALTIFRAKFDYIIISSEFGASKSFATSLLIAADAAVVSVRKGRRETADDAPLVAILDDMGPRFLGVAALEAAVINKYSPLPNVSTTIDVRRGQIVPVENDRKHRKSAESLS